MANPQMEDEVIAALANAVAVVMADLEDDDVEDYEDAMGPNWRIVRVNLDDYRTMGDPSFRLHFRMNRAMFENLRLVLGNNLVEQGVIQRERTPPELYLMHALWILATPDSFRSVALRFGVYPHTIHQHNLKIIHVLCDLAPTYIKWPSEEERRQIAEAFQRYSGFPGVVGLIDGTHIMMTAPLVQPRRFINRHHQFSSNIQVVCDHKGGPTMM